MPAWSFLLGNLTLMQFSFLPALAWLGVVLVVLMSLHYKIPVKSGLLIPLLFFIAGFFWADFRAQLVLRHTLPTRLQTLPLVLTGRVEGLPISTRYGTHLLIRIKNIQDTANKRILNAGRVLLQVKQGQYQPGDQVRCQTAFLPFHGLVNRGGINEEDWAFEQGVNLSGTAPRCDIIGSAIGFAPTVWMNRLRYHLLNLLQPCLPSTPHAAWLMALMIGEHSFVNPNDWTILNATGTNHLMAIGGLHLGMAAFWANFFMQAVWRRFHRGLLVMSTRTAGLIASVMVGFLYALLSGFSMPSARAFLMLLGYALIYALNRQTDSYRCLNLALLTVLVINPACVISPSFWLSFLTIAWLCYGFSARPHQKSQHFKQSLQVQWVVGLGLLPITLWYFQRDALLGSVSNLIAIPWVIFTILPFCLLAIISVFFSSTLCHALLTLAGLSMQGLWIVLRVCSHLPHWAMLNAINSPWTFGAAMFGMMLLLLPRGVPVKYLGVFFLCPIFFAGSNAIANAQYRLSVLDVGQGLSVFIQTKSHSLLYDTGGRLSPNSDEGLRVVVPTLYALHINKIDTLIISHGDNDHAGGVNAVWNALPIDQFLTSVPAQFPGKHARLCEAGQHWRWDGVDFQILSPKPGQFGGNNASCVLRISNGSLTALLPGDIQNETEAALIAARAPLLADVLIAPHHGSQTSSSLAWIAAVNPEWVIYSAGFHNRYHLPNAAVVARYQKQGVNALETVSSGEIDITMGKMRPQLTQYRLVKKRFWFDQA